MTGATRLFLITAEILRQRGWRVMDTSRMPSRDLADFALVGQSPTVAVLHPLRPELGRVMTEIQVWLVRRGGNLKLATPTSRNALRSANMTAG